MALILLTISVFAQQRPSRRNFFATWHTNNPAYNADTTYNHLITGYTVSAVGYDYAPSTLYFTSSFALPSGRYTSAFGWNYQVSRFNPFATSEFMGNYALGVQLNEKYKLAAGIQVRNRRIAIDANRLHSTSNFEDPVIQGSSQLETTSFNFKFGLSLESTRGKVGVSLLGINRGVTFNTYTHSNFTPYLLHVSGNMHFLQNDKFKITGYGESFLGGAGIPFVQLAVMGDYMKKVKFGLGINSARTASISAGFTLIKRLSALYTYSTFNGLDRNLVFNQNHELTLTTSLARTP